MTKFENVGRRDGPKTCVVLSGVPSRAAARALRSASVTV
jgi:hypothetical protein